MHRTIGIGSRRQPRARRLDAIDTNVIQNDYVRGDRRDRAGRCRDYRRWRTRFALVAAVAYDALEQQDVPRAIVCLCEVVCLEHAIALATGGPIVAQSDMRGATMGELQYLLQRAEYAYFLERAKPQPDEAEMERLRARCDTLTWETRHGELRQAADVAPTLTIDPHLPVGLRLRGSDGHHYEVTAPGVAGRVLEGPVVAFAGQSNGRFTSINHPLERPAGLDSGVALREYRDQTTQRFAIREDWAAQRREAATVRIGNADMRLIAEPTAPRDRAYVLADWPRTLEPMQHRADADLRDRTDAAFDLMAERYVVIRTAAAALALEMATAIPLDVVAIRRDLGLDEP